MTDYQDKEHWQIMLYDIKEPKTPEQLLALAVDYFKWVDMNPITAKKSVTSGKEVGRKVDVEFKRPYELKAMCLHCGINERWINDIKDTHQKESEWYKTMEKILMVIYNQNLEGAIVDLYNPIMISKVLKMDVDTGQNQAKIQVEIINSGPKLENTENEVLQNLDFGKVEILKDKVQNSSETNS